MIRQFKALSSMLVFASLVACGSDSTTNKNETAQGVFKDSNVAGMSYVSGDISGVTDNQGRFTYEVGKDVTFSIGGIKVGTAKGANIITPVDLVEDGSLDNTQVKNMVRLFMLLDEDGDPSNGINIEESLRSLADSWDDIDLAADITTQLTQISSDLTSLYGNRSIPTDQAARTHFLSTLKCVHSGTFVGVVDNRPFAFVLDPQTGKVSGYIKYSDKNVVSFSDIDTMQYAKKAKFTIDKTIGKALFTPIKLALEVEFITPNKITIDWSDGLFSGKVEAVRLGERGQVKQRISGLMSGDRFGAFEIHFNGSKAVSGKFLDMSDGKQYGVSGTLTGDKLKLTTTDGLTLNATFLNGFNTLNGTWLNADSTEKGSLSGSGCLTSQTVRKDYCEALTTGQEFTIAPSGKISSILSAHYPVTISSDAAFKGVGASVNLDIGADSNILFGEHIVKSSVTGQDTTAGTFVPKGDATHTISTIVTVKDTGPAVSGAILAAAVNKKPMDVSVSYDSEEPISFVCSKGHMSVSGDFRFSGEGKIDADLGAAGTISLPLSLQVMGKEESSGRIYTVSESPSGGVILYGSGSR